MSSRLADAIIRTRTPQGVTMLRATVTGPGTARLPDGGSADIDWWCGTPVTGQPCQLLLSPGAVIGLALTAASRHEEA